jgi:hypothetical protein
MRKNLQLSFCCGALICVFSSVSLNVKPASAQDAASPEGAAKAAEAAQVSQSSAESRVRELEASRLEAMVKSDTATLKAILHDDLRYTHSNGIVQNKKELIEGIESGQLKYRSIAARDTQVRMLGDVAVLLGNALLQISAKHEDLNFEVYFTAVYVQQQGNWQLVAWQSTQAAAKK